MGKQVTARPAGFKIVRTELSKTYSSEVWSQPLDYSYTVGKGWPWESIQQHADGVRIQELFFDFVFLTWVRRMPAARRQKCFRYAVGKLSYATKKSSN
jgi:hypothetical protein